MAYLFGQRSHNLKVIGSNPIPATNLSSQSQWNNPPLAGFFIPYVPLPADTKGMRLNPTNELDDVRCRCQSVAEISAVQNWHKTAQNRVPSNALCSARIHALQFASSCPTLLSDQLRSIVA
jgi:hypothetical protein